jgi:hypothetical protein
MKTLGIATRERVNSARTHAAGMPGTAVSHMVMGTCLWFKRIPAVAYPPPGVLEMV